MTLGGRIMVLTLLIDFSTSDVLPMVQTRGLKDAYLCHRATGESCEFCASCWKVLNAEKKRW